MSLHFVAHAGAGIDHADDDVFAREEHRRTEAAARSGRARSTIAVSIVNWPPLAHRVARVHGEVQDDLGDLAADRP